MKEYKFTLFYFWAGGGGQKKFYPGPPKPLGSPDYTSSQYRPQPFLPGSDHVNDQLSLSYVRLETSLFQLIHWYDQPVEKHIM